MKFIALFFVLLLNQFAFSQQQLDFKMLRYDEDYAAVKTDSTSTFFDKIKHIQLTKSDDLYLSFGGELRSQYQYFKDENWGDTENDKDGFLLNRTLFHTDFHYKKVFRIFSQLQSSTAISRIDPSPVERNDLDIHQLFFDFTFDLEKSSLLFRFGRQEMLYGSQRLVSVREGPNSRQAFDAVKVAFKNGKFKSDVFYSQYVKNITEIFDDRMNPDIKFFGIYNAFNKLPIVENIDFYYLGLKKSSAEFDDAQGKELRHSVGTRIWRKNHNWNYDAEAVYQFGSVGAKNIEAWTLSLNTSYQFATVKFKPVLGLKTEFISGDKKYDDDKIQTFNPLFPKGAYFGLAALVGPSNLFDIHPSIDLELKKDIIFSVDYDIFWRMSRNDGVYQPNTILMYSGKNTSKKYIGNQLGANLNYDVNNWLAFRIEGTWFNTKDYLKEVTSGRDIIFGAATVYLRF